MQKAVAEKINKALPRLIGNELIGRILKNSAYLFSATGIAAGLSMLQSILVARLLGVTEFGILGTITMFTSVINKFGSFRMSELVIKYVGLYSVSGDQNRAAAVFKSAAIVETFTSLLTFGLIVLLAPLGALYFAKDAAMSRWFVLYGLIVLANFIVESSTGLLQISDRYRFIAGVTVAQSCLTLALIGIIYLHRGGFIEIVLAYMVGKVVGALGLAIGALQMASRRWGEGWWRVSLATLKGQTGELIRFAISTNLSASINLVNKDGELLWVSALRNPTEAGYYKLALSLVSLVQLPISPLPQATYPELSREVAGKNWENLRDILKRGSLIALIYSAGAGLFLAAFGRPLISYVYTPEYLPAYPALLILIAGLLVANTFYWNRISLLSLALPDYPARVNLAAAVLKIVGAFTLVPRLGYLASAGLLSGFYLFSVTFNVRKTIQILAASGNDEA